MRTVTISSLKNKIKYFFNLIIDSSEILIIPWSNDDTGIVILSLKEYNSLVETNYLLSSKENRKRLLDSIHHLENDKLIPYELDNESKS